MQLLGAQGLIYEDTDTPQPRPLSHTWGEEEPWAVQQRSQLSPAFPSGGCQKQELPAGKGHTTGVGLPLSTLPVQTSCD